MKDQVLSIKQMQHLKELGIDTSKASMVLIYYDENGNEVGWDVENHGVDSPLFETYDSEYECCNSVRPEYLDAETGNYDHSYRADCGVFTLQDMIELMPENLVNANKYHKCVLRFGKKYVAYYSTLLECNIHVESHNDLLNNAYNMLVWLAENKYIQTATIVSNNE